MGWWVGLGSFMNYIDMVGRGLRDRFEENLDKIISDRKRGDGLNERM